MNAEYYNKGNKMQMSEAILLIDRISNDYKDKEIDCILDIGCGPGNVTLLLKRIERVNSIVGVDVDEKNIEFAEKYNNGNNDIEYFTQDLGLEWNHLRTELKELEAKVTIIFSNFCLHWIYTNKENVIKNMFRLLSKKGRLYSLFTCMPNPLDKMPVPVIPSILGPFLRVPSKEEQEKEWTDSFKKTGFEIIEYKYLDKKYSHECDEFDKMSTLGFPIYQQFYGKCFINVCKSATNFINSMISVKPSYFLPQHKDEITGQIMCQMDYQSFLYILRKN